MGITDGPIFKPPEEWEDRLFGPVDKAMKLVSKLGTKREVFKDPLNCPFSRIIYYISSTRQNSWSCSCGADFLKGQAHMHTCLITPEYAATSIHLDMAPHLVAGAIAFRFWSLNWQTWDQDKYAIRDFQGGQEIEYGK